MIEFATLNRFNNLLVQVRGRGDAYYESNLVPKSNLIKDVDFDPLAFLIPLAKEKGIRVHAWVNTYLLWSSRVMPVQKNHILKTNPGWMDQNTQKKINISIEMKKFNGGKFKVSCNSMSSSSSCWQNFFTRFNKRNFNC